MLASTGSIFSEVSEVMQNTDDAKVPDTKLMAVKILEAVWLDSHRYYRSGRRSGRLTEAAQ